MLSSIIADFEYDTDRAQLTVRFVSGRTYRYFLVPSDCVTRFAAAESKGGFFNRYIRDKYPCREVTPRAGQANRVARYGAGSTNGVAPLIMSPINRPVDGPSVKPQ